MTALDQAFLSAKADTQKVEDYYREFLNTTLIVPLIAPIDATAGKVPDQTQAPVLIVEIDGERYLPVFDTLERFQAWVPQPLHYIELKAHNLIAGLDGSSRVFLNTNTEYAKVFVKEEILGLQALLETSGQATYSAGDKLFIREARGADPKAVALLEKSLAEHPEALAAYLVEIAEEDDANPHLLLMVRCENEESYEALFRDLDVALRTVLQPDRPLDLKAFADDEIDAVIIENAPPFYQRA